MQSWLSFMAASLIENDSNRCEMVRQAVHYHGGEEMSRRNFHALAWLVAAPLCGLIAVMAIALSISCDPNDQSEGGLDKYFLRDVAAMQDMGLPVYWLGREFNVGALAFQGPYGVGFGGEVEGGGIFMQYISWLEGTPGEGTNTSLEMTEYSRGAWDLVKDRIMNSSAPGITRRAVSVQGEEAVMILQAAGARPLNEIWLVLDRGDVTVVASANSGGPVSPGGPDYNTFINNPDLLVQVMQDLRHYPE